MLEMVDVLDVEVCQKHDSTLSRDEIEQTVREELNLLVEVDLNIPIVGEKCTDNILKSHVISIVCTCNHAEKNQITVANAEVRVYVYRLEQEDGAIETMQNDSEEVPVSSHWILPAQEFYGLWENLYYDSDIQENLLHFVETMMVYSDRRVNPNIINCNRVVLLHGPPGTGKTSMCRALAQKIAIRLGDRYSRGELVEINSHSLFSKWFSESGKLVMKLFGEIRALLEDPRALVCVLIDEVESLAHARKSSLSGTEPSDSIRVVNALLTQLDQLKRYPNVLILTTSNVTEAIDLAFVDRADINQFIGHPQEQAIYKIYHSCLRELMRTDFIEYEMLHSMSYLKKYGYEENPETKKSLQLLELSRQSVGLSGRTLRKIPFLAHALYLHAKKSSLHRFLRAMHFAIERQREIGAE
ncbi:pachytene checkpoint protein 2 homolog [Orussus abietinus]|uniref:pachytene checkpoint protein 2 homolog n=1 Tax=Orussus abietinus TaxID=222816 RepID=UPI0006256CAE|nr:pachytene checkpoint protein 2 homolog [Orussus abietinus]